VLPGAGCKSAPPSHAGFLTHSSCRCQKKDSDRQLPPIKINNNLETHSQWQGNARTRSIACRSRYAATVHPLIPGPTTHLAVCETRIATDTPQQTNQHIASYLTGDSDLCNFRLISQSTHDAVDADNNSFWRRRFLAVFETPMWGANRSGDINVKFKREYQRRRRCLLFGAKYEAAVWKHEGKEIRKGTEALEVLRELLVGECSSERQIGWNSR